MVSLLDKSEIIKSIYFKNAWPQALFDKRLTKQKQMFTK